MTPDDGRSIDRSLLERVELAFPELVGDHEVLERDLVLDGRPLADWLALAPGGALLVSVVDGAADAAPLRALDGLAIARTRPDLLLGARTEDAGDPPLVRVVLVALEGYSEVQLERLAPLAGDDLWLLRRRELASARGTHTRLEALDLSAGDAARDPVALPSWALRRPFHDLLARIAPDRLQLALDLVGRLRRVDGRLAWSTDGALLECAAQGRRLASLAWTEGELRVELDEQSPLRRVRDRESLDEAVEAVLAAHLARLGDPSEERLERPRPRPAGEPLFAAEDDLPEDELDEGFDDDDLPTHELRPLPPGPLLTPEEIRAFQE